MMFPTSQEGHLGSQKSTFRGPSSGCLPQLSWPLVRMLFGSSDGDEQNRGVQRANAHIHLSPSTSPPLLVGA